MEGKHVLELVRQNDNAAQRELFEQFYQRTYAVAYSILRNRESAEDITQDAFIKAFRNLHQLREQEKFGAWLAVIASNLARNHLKREKRIIISDEPDQYNSHSTDAYTAAAEEQVVREIEVEQVRAAVRSLPSEQYQVVVLQYYYDLKLEEIARMLKISTGTVKSRLFRARQKLTRTMELNEDGNCLNIKGGGGDKCPLTK